MGRKPKQQAKNSAKQNHIGCSKCRSKVYEETIYEKHWDKEHPELNRSEMYTEGIKCDHCPRYFAFLKGFQNHNLECHQNEKQNNTANSFTKIVEEKKDSLGSSTSTQASSAKVTRSSLNATKKQIGIEKPNGTTNPKGKKGKQKKNRMQVRISGARTLRKLKNPSPSYNTDGDDDDMSDSEIIHHKKVAPQKRQYKKKILGGKGVVDIPKRTKKTFRKSEVNYDRALQKFQSVLRKLDMFKQKGEHIRIETTIEAEDADIDSDMETG